MTGEGQEIGTIALFEELAESEMAAVREVMTAAEWQAGEAVYSLGDPGGSMFAVLEGAIEIYSIVSGTEKLFMTVREGQVFGLLSVLDAGTRPGHARALEPTRALVMDRPGLDQLLDRHPEIGVKVLRGLGRTLGERVRMLTEQFEATVAWNLEVTGLASLGLERLMTERIEVTVETTRGEPLSGSLLRLESSAAGHELYVETSDHQIHVIPYHAIVRLSVARDRIEDREETPTL